MCCRHGADGLASQATCRALWTRPYRRRATATCWLAAGCRQSAGGCRQAASVRGLWALLGSAGGSRASGCGHGGVGRDLQAGDSCQGAGEGRRGLQDREQTGSTGFQACSRGHRLGHRALGRAQGAAGTALWADHEHRALWTAGRLCGQGLHAGHRKQGTGSSRQGAGGYRHSAGCRSLQA